MATTDPSDPADSSFVRVADAANVREEGRKLVTADGRHVAVFFHDGEFRAVDNRCPHMGFPLMDGTVDDGILTCHWHHARFELSCGDTFDPWADDVQTFPIEERDGDLYVDPHPEPDEPPEVHWRNRLRTGLEENLNLVIAKSVIGLADTEVGDDVPVEIGVDFGTQFREMGWGRGLTTLALLANLVPDLEETDRQRALYQGLIDVAEECSGEAPNFEQPAFGATETDPDQLERWFREMVEVRDSDGAERSIRTAAESDLPESRVADMVFAAATDHLYLNTGHSLDFCNKAFETLDAVGWEHAPRVLGSLVDSLAQATRSEELSQWRQPVDVAGLLFDAYEDLDELVAAGEGAGEWTPPAGLTETLLSDDPHAIVDALTDAVADGATVEELAREVTFAAVRRVAHFGTTNEFNDWNTVHHTFTYANAVHGAARRTETHELYRGVFDAAMNVYLDRFLNTPPTPIPESREPDASPAEIREALLEVFDEEGGVDEAARLVGDHFDADGDPAELKRTLGHGLVREDAGFHTFQNVEAGFRQFDLAADPDRRRTILIAVARYLAAHFPTRRSREQTFDIARRLHAGDMIHEG